MADKYNPGGQPPSYPQPAHHDAGPYHGSGAPPPQTFSPAPGQNMYGQPQYGAPGLQQDYYGNGPPQGGYYGGGPQPQMNYGPPMQGGPGYYQDNRHNGGRPGGIATGGICAALTGALACCCCLDCLF